MEDGDCHFSRSLSRRNDIESDHRPGDSFVAFSCRQCRVQCLHRRAFDLGSHAVDHAGSSRLASLTYMKKLLCVMVATPLLLANNSRADDAPPHPQFKLSRQDEDWSVLRDPALRTDAFDTVKFIPLNRDGSSWLTLGGEVRERYEYFDNFNWGKGPQDDNGYLLQRYMIHADAHIGEHFRVFTQFKSGLEDGRNGVPRPTDRDEFDVHQLFADVRVPFDEMDSLTLRVGRQELSFGTQRLVSVRESPNVRQSFDGARATLRWTEWQFDAFAKRPVETKTGVFDDGSDPRSKFWGFYGVAPFPLLAGGKADFYYLGVERDSARFNQGTARELRHSIGMRLWGNHSG